MTETLADSDPSSPSRAVSQSGSITTPATTSSDIELKDAPHVNAKDKKNDDSDTSSLYQLQRHILSGPVTGYPGQFESYESDHLHYIESTLTAAPESHTFGDPAHPNGLLSHTNFIADPTFPSPNYTKRQLDALPERNMALVDAEHKTATYSLGPEMSARRTPGEILLRREAMRELAMARLEGVAAGEYRYYQGFLDLEEYVAARMCVCWARCWCSKLCGRWGDVRCPCSEWVVVHSDDG